MDKRLLLLGVCILMITIPIAIGSNSTKSPGTMANVPVSTYVNWTNPDNAKASDDNVATVVTTIPGLSSYLKASNFSFAIPTGATINGIITTIERKRYGTAGLLNDERVSLVLANGTVSSTNLANTTVWTTSDVTVIYGNSTYLWGENWTAENINDIDFGFIHQLDNGASGIGVRNGSIDHMTITVDYTESSMSNSTCSCPSPAAAWEISMTEHCNLTTSCDLDGFSVSFENGTSGDYCNVYTTIRADNFYFNQAGSGTAVQMKNASAYLRVN